MKKKIIVISGVIIILVFIFGFMLLSYKSGQANLFASGCNVQGVKLYGSLYTYKNSERPDARYGAYMPRKNKSVDLKRAGRQRLQRLRHSLVGRKDRVIRQAFASCH